MSPKPLLVTTRLSRAFGGLRALSNVDFTLHERELHALIGPNGAGKSTFVNLLSGQLKATSGSIHLQGQDVTGTPAWRMVHLGVARSFQRTNILKSLSVLENVRLAAQAVHLSARSLWRSPARADRLVEKAHEALRRVGLQETTAKIAGTLSHGAQRQLEIALALAGDPKVLLLDEPMAGMGAEEGEAMAALLQKLAQDHAVLLIEHDMDFVFKVAHRLSVLVDGTVLASGTPDEVRGNLAVQSAYLGEVG